MALSQEPLRSPPRCSKTFFSSRNYSLPSFQYRNSQMICRDSSRQPSSESSPVKQRPIFLAIHRKIRLPIRKTRCHLFVDVNAQPGFLAWMHVPLKKSICMRKQLFRFRVVQHVFLDAEIVDG